MTYVARDNKGSVMVTAQQEPGREDNRSSDSDIFLWFLAFMGISGFVGFLASVPIIGTILGITLWFIWATVRALMKDK